jgi:ribosomal protein L36
MCPTSGKTSVESSLKKLCRNGDIVKMGSGRATFYVISDAL